MTTTDTSAPWTADEVDEFVTDFLHFADDEWVEVPTSVGQTFARALRAENIGFTHHPRIAVCTRHDPHETDRFTRVRRTSRPRLH